MGYSVPKMMFRTFPLIAILLGLSVPSLFAQKMYPVVQSSLYPNNLVEYQGSGAIVQDTSGLTLIGFTFGVIEFDGREKILSPTESPVLSMILHRPTNRIYVSCQHHFGYLKRAPDGKFIYNKLSTRLNLSKSINQPNSTLTVIGDEIYFYYSHRLFTYNVATDEVKVMTLATNESPALGVFNIGNQLFINHPTKGFCRYANGNLLKSSQDTSLQFRSIDFNTPFDKQRVLIGTSGNDLYLSDGKTHTPYATKAKFYLESSNDYWIAAAVRDSQVYLATSQNGVFVLDQKSGELKSILNIRYGLPENDVNGMFVDRDGRLWLAHNESFSWSYVGLPINRYTRGFTGNINSVLFTDNLFVATDNGVFYSTRYSIDDVSEQMLLSAIGEFNNRPRNDPQQFFDLQVTKEQLIQQVQSNVDFSASQRTLTQAEQANKPQTETDTWVGGLLKGKKKKEREQQLEDDRRRAEEQRQQQLQQAQQQAVAAAAEEAASKAEQLIGMAEQQRKQAEQMRIQQMQHQQKLAMMYQEYKARRDVVIKNQDFERVIDIPEEKFTSLISFNGRILAGSLNGLYELIGNRAQKIQSVPVKLLHKSLANPAIVYVLLPDNSFGTVKWDGYQWSFAPLYRSSGFVNSIAEDEKGTIWLGTPKGTYQLTSSDLTSTKLKAKLLMPNPDTLAKQAVNLLQAGNRVIFLQNQKAYLNDGKAFKEHAELSRLLRPGVPVMLTEGSGSFWLTVGGMLYKLRLNPQAMTIVVLDSSALLQLSDRFSTLYADPNNHIWTASQNKLLGFTPTANIPSSLNQNFAAVIRSVKVVTNNDGLITKTPVENLVDVFELDYSPGYTLEFEFTAPSYDNPSRLRYQYKIKEEDQWKELEINKLSLEFSWGKYNFQVRAIDTFGNTSVTAAFKFEIASPLWAKAWFWAIVILVLGFGIWKFFQVRQQQLIKRKEELEKQVAEATVEIRDQNTKLETFNVKLQEQSEELLQQNDKLEQSNIEINKQKDISEKLLLNILPHQTAEELKKTGRAVARKYQQVSVLFSDLKGFTKVTENMPPEQLVVELDQCFLAFDEIVEIHNLEKIKTMGDGYMCAGGIPNRNDTNPIDAVLAGLEMQRFMARLAAEKKKKGENCWEIRIGVHTGELVAGVVGKKKFAYDIWGDTVNTASRMESSGEVAKVNVTEDTYNHVKDFFTCTYRGKVPAKNKGEIAMYFIDAIKPELSKNGAGIEPNEAFKQKLKNLKPSSTGVLTS